MHAERWDKLPGLLEALGLDEEPLGLFYTDAEPAQGFAPKPMALPTREREMQNAIDWKAVFANFSCALGHIWRSRRKGGAAWFSAERFGCPGASFWLGFNKPQTETIIHYVSTGIPNFTAGEHYCSSPEALRRIFAFVDPRPAPRPYCVVKPLGSFAAGESPELVIFFARPEALCGLHQLAAYVTDDPEVVASPWSAACGSLAAWPLHYLGRGANKAVIGGWDPSARKFFKTDELSFTVPRAMFEEMLARWESSFLTKETWPLVRKKIARSREVWGGSKTAE